MKRLVFLGLVALSSVQHFFRERLTLAGWLVFAAAATAAALGIDTSRTMTYQLFAFLAAALGISFLWAAFFRARVCARRELPRYASVGQALEYAAVVENLGRTQLRGLSLAERLRDPRPRYAEWRAAREPGEERRNWFDRTQGYFRWRWLIERRTPRRSPEAPLPPLAPSAPVRVQLSLTPRRRGRIELAGLKLARTDPLGLVRGVVRLPAPARLIALPKRYRLPPLALPGRRRFQQGGVTLATSVGDSEEFIGLREYRPGDALQKVHWKSFARAGIPIVREYQDEFFERHALVLDTCTTRGEGPVFEEAVSIAASFVYAIDTRESLLDLLLVGGEVRTYTAGRGQMQVDHMLEVLAGVAPSAPQEFDALARAVLAQRQALSSFIAVLVEWDERRRGLVEAVARSGVDARVLLVCPRGHVPASLPAGVLALHPGEIEAGLARLQ
ncbi:MAG: DUF58 domain-containing protein [Betaproteobacteria bacterium]